MTADEFVKAIAEFVAKPAARHALDESPPKQPNASDLERVTWVKSLSQSEKDKLLVVTKHAVDLALFGLFCVIDGVRVVENGPEKSDFELHSVKAGMRTPLNGRGLEELHNLYNWYSRDSKSADTK